MSILRILKRDLGAQFRESRNLGETFTKKFARAFWAIVYLAKALRCAVNMTRKECLGSRVVFDGRECFVSNWAGSPYPTLAGDGFYQEHCPREQINNIVNASELWHRFTFGFGFYMGSWHGIDVNKRLYN